MNERDEKLDLIRGLSAVVVLLAHVRALVLVDFRDLVNPGLLTKAFYFLTGIHHQAVMVFFVLSGYFVGGKVLSTFGSGSFTWTGYALARLTRLWLVLIPALLLTFFLDAAGATMAREAYAGALQDRFMSGPAPGTADSITWATFFGNLAFLQTIIVPVFGTNGPLWSLANEFWYYFLFPLALGVVFHRSLLLRLLAAGLVVSLLYWLPKGLVISGLVWLMGAVTFWLTRQPWLPRWVKSAGWLAFWGMAFAASLAASKSDSILGSDWMVGLFFALCLPALLGPWGRRDGRVSLSTTLASLSYSLYAVHFPVLFFIAATQLHGHQFPPGVTGSLWFFGLTCASLLAAALIWWLFERNNDVVRRWVGRRLRAL